MAADLTPRKMLVDSPVAEVGALGGFDGNRGGFFSDGFKGSIV